LLVLSASGAASHGAHLSIIVGLVVSHGSVVAEAERRRGGGGGGGGTTYIQRQDLTFTVTGTGNVGKTKTTTFTVTVTSAPFATCLRFLFRPKRGQRIRPVDSTIPGLKCRTNANLRARRSPHGPDRRSNFPHDAAQTTIPADAQNDYSYRWANPVQFNPQS